MNNVILISIDNLRYDCVGYQPDKRELIKHDVLKYLETPMLDSIAEKSLCFTQCISTNTYTTASHASIFTGLYPPKHGVRAFYDTRLSNKVTTLAETLKRNGYRTILFTDSLDLFIPLGLNRGFEFELTRDDKKLFNLLTDLKDDRVFLFVHVMDVHQPFLHNTNEFRPGVNNDYFDEVFKLYKDYNLLEFYDRNGNSAELWNRLVRGPLKGKPIDVLFPLYVRGVTKFDKGRFSYIINNLKSIGFINGALMAIFSDHGEGRCFHEDKKYFSHGGALYDNVLRVPLLMCHPDLKPETNDKLVSTVDIYPTILSILNINSIENKDGINILSEKREMCYAEFWGSESKVEFYKTSDGSIKPLQGQWPESMLRQMAVRTDTHKFVKWNKGKTEEFLNEEVFRLSNIEYVKKLYRDILGRLEDPEGLQNAVSALNSGARTKKEMLADFLNSKEYKSTPKLGFYNLTDDMEEDSPIDGSTYAEARNYFAYMERLNSQAVVTEKIFDEREKPDTYRFMGKSSEIIEDKAILFKSLKEKERQSIEIIKRAVELYGADNIGIAWTGGKDSTTVLHLIRQVFDGHIPFKVINIDTSVKFPEIYAFRDRLHKEWGFDLRIFRNEDASKWLKISNDHVECCYQLKTVPLNQAIESLGLKALITGVRWDEQEARADEEYFSKRDNPEHIRVQPILHFREVDIWQYIKKYNIPYCELYNKGYRSLGCAPCTDLSSGRHERSGRAQDKEKIMAKLRELGYF